MAQKVEVEFVDDIDGSPAEGTVKFALENKSWEIDLSPANKERLQDALAEFIKHGRRVTAAAVSAGTRSSVRGNSEENRAIRAWYRSQGGQIGDRGRIPVEIVDLYRKRNGNGSHADVTAFRPSPAPRDEVAEPVFSAE